jgi:hypothetical protein
MEVSRMKVVDEVARALGASILTVLLIAAMTATITTASDYYKVYEYSTAVYRLEWDKDNRMFTIARSIYSGSFQFYSWDFTDKHREIENNKPYYNVTVLRHVTIEYWGYMGRYGCEIYWVETVEEKVDWPVNIVFYGPKVTKHFVYTFLKDITWLTSRFWSTFTSTMYMYLRNYNTSWMWDSDGGFKDRYTNVPSLIGWTYSCSRADGSYVFLHIRFYAPTQRDGQKYFTDGNMRYVIATAHFDRDETLWGGRGSGWSECAEKFLIDYIEANEANARRKGYTVRVFKNYAYGYNEIDYDGQRAIGLHAVTIRKSLDDHCNYIVNRKGTEDKGLYHVYLNDGLITFIYVDR